MNIATETILNYKEVIIPTVLSAASFYGGYAVNSPAPHAQECAPEITQNKVLEKQIAGMNVVTHQKVMEATRACKATEEEICQDKLTTFEASYKQLRCSICEAQGGE